MNYFHTDDPKTIAWLSGVAQRAEREGLRLRLRTDSQNRLMVKLGGGVWSAPIASTDDPFRDRELPMGGCSTASAHYAHLETGNPTCENGT